MDEMVIREASLSDINALLIFEQGLIDSERRYDITIKKGTIFYYNLEEMILSPNIQILVAEKNNLLVAVGYAYVMDSKAILQHPKYASLGFMYVDPKYRGRGLNCKIIEKLKNWLHSKGVNELRLEVYCENSSAIRAYEKVGFTKHLLEMRLDIS